MEDVFNIRYNTELDKLQIVKQSKGDKLFRILQKHKFLSIAFASFISLLAIDFYLIFSFIKILENIWKKKK